MNNQDRADHAEAALNAYFASKGETPEGTDYEISDLICDLLHLSDHRG